MKTRLPLGSTIAMHREGDSRRLQRQADVTSPDAHPSEVAEMRAAALCRARSSPVRPKEGTSWQT